MVAGPGYSSKHKHILVYCMLAGTWCIATFFLTTIYGVDLVAHVTAPNPKPLLGSIYDMLEHPEIQVVLNYDTAQRANQWVSIVNT